MSVWHCSVVLIYPCLSPDGNHHGTNLGAQGTVHRVGQECKPFSLVLAEDRVALVFSSLEQWVMTTNQEKTRYECALYSITCSYRDKFYQVSSVPTEICCAYCSFRALYNFFFSTLDHWSKTATWGSSINPLKLRCHWAINGLECTIQFASSRAFWYSKL